MSSWPLLTGLVRLRWLRALCSVAEGATTTASATAKGPELCVAAVLGDAQTRLCFLGGRDGKPRSLGSVLGCFVARFLGGLCGKEFRRILMPGVASPCNGVAVARNGSALVVSDSGSSNAIHVYCIADGTHERSISSVGGERLFKTPCQVCVSPDDFVFVAEHGKGRIRILTPQLESHGAVGDNKLEGPAGVCANDKIIAVSEMYADRITVFGRADGALRCRFGKRGRGVGEFKEPRGMCFMGRSFCIAVADYGNNRVSIFRANGEFVRTVGSGKLALPCGVSSSADGDELVVADYGNKRVVVFSAYGDMMHAMGGCAFAGVAVHCNAIYAQKAFDEACVVFK